MSNIVVSTTGRIVAENITTHRKRLNLTPSELARRIQKLAEENTPQDLYKSKIGKQAIALIEAGKRRVDTDELTYFAQALGVSPAILLMPPAQNQSDMIHTVHGQVNAFSYWEWLTNRDLPVESNCDRAIFHAVSTPKFNQ